MVKPKEIKFKEDRVKYWLGVGAKPTATVWNLLVDQKMVEGKKMKATTGHKVDTTEKK